MIDLLFMALIALSFSYSCLRGGKDGRRVVGIFTVSVVLSAIIPTLSQNVWMFNAYILGVDIVILLLLLPIAASTAAFWPLWVMGFHLSNTITDLVIVGGFRWTLQETRLFHEFWSIPELVAMTWGIMLDDLNKSNRHVCILRKPPRHRGAPTTPSKKFYPNEHKSDNRLAIRASALFTAGP